VIAIRNSIRSDLQNHEQALDANYAENPTKQRRKYAWSSRIRGKYRDEGKAEAMTVGLNVRRGIGPFANI